MMIYRNRRCALTVCIMLALWLRGSSVVDAGEIGDLLITRAEQLQRSPPAPISSESVAPPTHYRRIGLERGRSCAEALCPSYTMFLYGDDSLLYTGQGFPQGSQLPNGQLIARLDSTLASDIRAYLDRHAIPSTDLVYGLPGSHAWSLVLVETDTEQRLLVDYGHAAPPEIWALIGLLEHAAWSALHGNEFDH